MHWTNNVWIGIQVHPELFQFILVIKVVSTRCLFRVDREEELIAIVVLVLEIEGCFERRIVWGEHVDVVEVHLDLGATVDGPCEQTAFDGDHDDAPDGMQCDRWDVCSSQLCGKTRRLWIVFSFSTHLLPCVWMLHKGLRARLFLSVFWLDRGRCSHFLAFWSCFDDFVFVVGTVGAATLQAVVWTSVTVSSFSSGVQNEECYEKGNLRQIDPNEGQIANKKDRHLLGIQNRKEWPMKHEQRIGKEQGVWCRVP